MFCNKPNVNLLTAFLLAHGIEDAVVCPGSRNAVIVHNLNEMCHRGAIRLHPVTDERCASFVAIGLWLATRRPVAVCVTSGSALLNLLPGVAEAYYRHIPLVIISADRPSEWIGQLDGQTLPQPDALLPYAPSWNIADSDSEATLRHRLAEAFATLPQCGGSLIHLNVPLAEPLFAFSTTELPTVPQPPETYSSYINARTRTAPTIQPDTLAIQPETPDWLEAIGRARCPALIIGEWEEARIPAVATLQSHGWTIFAENISNHDIYNDILPPDGIDLLVHIGGALVEKQLKLQLRALPRLTIIRIDETDECPKTFGHVDYKVKAHPADALAQVAARAQGSQGQSTMTQNWVRATCPCDPAQTRALFLGNSTAVRWANRHLRLPVPTYCNRGVNGIEGSLSVAAGYSLAPHEDPAAKTLCIIGDLSFFYDSNALWNQKLTGDLRILLVNNHRGDIFHRLPGLGESPALPEYIAAAHDNSARGIADSYHVTYLSAHTTDLVRDIDALLTRLLTEPSERPVILEVTI